MNNTILKSFILTFCILCIAGCHSSQNDTNQAITSTSEPSSIDETNDTISVRPSSGIDGFPSVDTKFVITQGNEEIGVIRHDQLSEIHSELSKEKRHYVWFVPFEIGGYFVLPFQAQFYMIDSTTHEYKTIDNIYSVSDDEQYGVGSVKNEIVLTNLNAVDSEKEEISTTYSVLEELPYVNDTDNGLNTSIGSPVLSPDNSQIAFTAYHREESKDDPYALEEWMIYVLSRDTGELSQIGTYTDLTFVQRWNDEKNVVIGNWDSSEIIDL